MATHPAEREEAETLRAELDALRRRHDEEMARANQALSAAQEKATGSTAFTWTSTR